MQNSTDTEREPRNPSQQQVQLLIGLYSQGRLQDALALIADLLPEFPECGFLYNIQGASHVGLGQLDAAIVSYGQALAKEPRDPKTHFNLGNALAESGDLPAAIESYRLALKIDPGYALAFNNLGNALKDEGDLSAAISCYRSALQLVPDSAEIHNNLANAQKDGGELEAAIASYRQALQIRPDYAEALNNMGSAFNEAGELERARDCYDRALTLSPDYADAAWNRAGAAADSNEAETWVARCLAADPDYADAKIQLAALHYFDGDRTGLDRLLQSPLREHPTLRSIVWVDELPNIPALYFNRWAFFDAIAKLSDQERPFYEFGVFRGVAFRYLIETFKRGYGFDTFEGIPEDWHDEKAGSYSSRGSIPRIAGGEFIAGRFEDTLPAFFSEARPLASVINFDADLYSSTLCALNNAKPVIDARTILIFDEFIVNEHWEQDEYRALNEFCTANELSYEVLAVSFFTKQVALRLVGF